MERVLSRIKQADFEVERVERRTKRSPAPLLYDLTELQREAKETLSIMQSLYERHKLVTYPRTDSRYLSSDMVETLADRKMCIRDREGMLWEKNI